MKEPEKTIPANFTFKTAPQSSPNALAIDELSVGYESTLISAFNLQVKKGKNCHHWR
ncbi:hypothetical protein GQR36_12730 [Enterococcus termitis]